MPELPELEIARERLSAHLAGRRIVRVAALDPFVLRSVAPPLDALVGRRVVGARRIGKHLVLDVEGELALAAHLMRAGRLRLRDARAFRPHRKRTLFVLEVEGDRLVEMTEAGTERRASVRVGVSGALDAEFARGVDPLDPTLTSARWAAALQTENRRLKTALRSPDVVAGIGNAYSDETLHAARLSPMRETRRLSAEEAERLRAAMVATLRTWIERVRAACPPGALPEKQELWRRHFAVHGKAGQPCPVCGTTIERISYVDSETDYCPTCQTGGRLLADRRLSRLGIRRGLGRPGESSSPTGRSAAEARARGKGSPAGPGKATREPRRSDPLAAGPVPPLAGEDVPCESSPSDAVHPREGDVRWATRKRPKRRSPGPGRKGPGSSRDARA